VRDCRQLTLSALGGDRTRVPCSMIIRRRFHSLKDG